MYYCSVERVFRLRVEHFSGYGLDYSDDSDDSDGAGHASAAPPVFQPAVRSALPEPRAAKPELIIGLTGVVEGPAAFQRDRVSLVPCARWDVENVGDRAVRHVATLPHVDAFDSAVFSLKSDEEALWLDPAQRLLLEAVGTLRCGMDGKTRAAAPDETAGVWVAATASDYAREVGRFQRGVSTHAGTGINTSAACGRCRRAPSKCR